MNSCLLLQRMETRRRKSREGASGKLLEAPRSFLGMLEEVQGVAVAPQRHPGLCS
jgi:hypothetical protein